MHVLVSLLLYIIFMSGGLISLGLKEDVEMISCIEKESLEALYLRGNSFIGEVPISLSRCIRLRFLDLGENKLSGVIPEWIGEELLELYVLVLGSNRFYGRLPSHVCWLSNIQVLDLSNNGLSGKERSFGRSGLELLKSIDLSRNNLSGKIPYEITSLYELFSINLSINKLHGKVPKDMGRIPTGSQLQCFNYTSYSGNPQLCGPPLTPRCGLSSPPTTVVGKEYAEDEDDFWKSFYIDMGVGISITF
ncbi:hypothetical protein SSX86_032664 [Deinandra increscens subsp. villosa]|uniref:Uncharacterized protein n=1 Tax=Deinandra increscens subsp. villosa TaxID=3103831 RepID=A0AAP0GGF9_9ASTR